MDRLRLRDWSPSADPVLRAELLHQYIRENRRLLGMRKRPVWQKAISWLLRGAIVLLIIFAGLPLVEFNPRDYLLIYLPAVTLLPFTAAFHFRLQFWTLALAANSITREHQNETWDLLVMTGRNTRQIVAAKLKAILLRMARMYTALLLLRGLIALWFVLVYLVTTYNHPFGQPPNWGGLLAFLLLLPLLTFGNLLLTAAAGTLASALTRRIELSLVGAGLLRLALIGTAFAALLALGMATFELLPDQDPLVVPTGALDFAALQVFFVSLFSLLDNGSLVGLSILTSQPSVAAGISSNVLYSVGTLLAVLVYVLLAWLALRVTYWLATRQGVLPLHPRQHRQDRQ